MRVSILGCGYVGLALGEMLSERGHEVVGVRRSDEGLAAVADAGLTPVRADLTDPDSLAGVPDADWLVVAASAGGDAEVAQALFVDGLRSVVDEFASRDADPDRLVFTSSTGVYGDHGGAWVDEETPIAPPNEKAEAIARGETVAREYAAERGVDGTVVRFAGLYGPGRYRLERYLDGPVTAGHLNLLHRADAAGVVAYLLESDRARDDLVLAVDDEPVSKWAFADWLAEQCGVDPPEKQMVAERLESSDLPPSVRDRIAADKRCSNRHLRDLGYSFAYPTFRDGYRAAIDAFIAGDGPDTE